MNTTKQTRFFKSLFTLACMAFALATHAQWDPPTVAAPGNNVPQLINVGDNKQVKSGPAAALILRSVSTWAPIIAGAFSLLTDQSLVSVLGSRPVADALRYGIVSTAPVSVNGIFNNSNMVAKLNLTTQSYFDQSLIRANSTQLKAPVCTTSPDGDLQPCAAGTPGVMNNPAPTVTLTVSPRGIPVNTPTSVTVSWSSTNATHCSLSSDVGLDTASMPASSLSATSGSFASYPIKLAHNDDKSVFTLVCTDENGLSAMTSTQVYTQAATLPDAPIVVLSFGDVNLNRSSDKLVYDGQGSTIWSFTLSAKISGGTATSCQTSTNKHSSVDPENLLLWPNAPTSTTPRTWSTVVNIGSVRGVAKYGWRSFSLTCSNAGGSSTDTVMIDHR